MINRASPIPLLTEKSASLESAIFTVHPGNMAYIQAFGFSDFKERVDATELREEQIAQLDMLIFRETKKNMEEDGPCHIERYGASSEVIAREPMYLDGRCFFLSKCNNILLINIPGTYVFTLNDPAAVGHVRIFLRTISKDEFPWPSNFMIGAL